MDAAKRREPSGLLRYHRARTGDDGQLRRIEPGDLDALRHACSDFLFTEPKGQPVGRRPTPPQHPVVGLEGLEPGLEVKAWCPSCREPHGWAWGQSWEVDGFVTIRVRAPCKAGPWKGSEVLVRLDRGRLAECRKTLAGHKAAFRRHEVQERLRLDWLNSHLCR